MATTKKTVVRRKTVSSKKKPTSKKTSSARAASSVSTSVFSSGRFENVPVAALLAELLGTFVLTAIIIQSKGTAVIVLFALAAIVLAIGHLSGAHVNPAITFGAWVTRKISTFRALGYVIAQVLGALLAFVVLSYLLGGVAPEQNPYTGQATSPELFKATELVKNKEIYTFWAEILGLSLFGFAVASAIREKKSHFATAYTVGGGLFIALLVAGPVAILNPAVAFGLQAFNDLKDAALWWSIGAHIVAPLIGGAIGFLFYDLLRRDTDTAA
jgi:glycerol uptake facilitator-like aquaporin